MSERSRRHRTYLDICYLLVLVQEAVKIPFTGEILQASERETLCGPIAANSENRVEVLIVFLQRDVFEEGLGSCRDLCIVG